MWCRLLLTWRSKNFPVNVGATMTVSEDDYRNFAKFVDVCVQYERLMFSAARVGKSDGGAGERTPAVGSGRRHKEEGRRGQEEERCDIDQNCLERARKISIQGCFTETHRIVFLCCCLQKRRKRRKGSSAKRCHSARAICWTWTCSSTFP